MIARATCKYGNQFMLLNIDKNNGIIGWNNSIWKVMKR